MVRMEEENLRSEKVGEKRGRAGRGRREGTGIFRNHHHLKLSFANLRLLFRSSTSSHLPSRSSRSRRNAS